MAQSCRGYTPFHFTHYKAHWCNISHWPKGGWPFTDPGGKVWDKRALEAFYAPWVKLKDSGVGVHCGEGGAYCFTEHEHVLAWMRDWLETLAALSADEADFSAKLTGSKSRKGSLGNCSGAQPFSLSGIAKLLSGHPWLCFLRFFP